MMPGDKEANNLPMGLGFLRLVDQNDFLDIGLQ